MYTPNTPEQPLRTVDVPPAPIKMSVGDKIQESESVLGARDSVDSNIKKLHETKKVFEKLGVPSDINYELKRNLRTTPNEEEEEAKYFLEQQRNKKIKLENNTMPRNLFNMSDDSDEDMPPPPPSLNHASPFTNKISGGQHDNDTFEFGSKSDFKFTGSDDIFKPVDQTTHDYPNTNNTNNDNNTDEKRGFFQRIGDMFKKKGGRTLRGGKNKKKKMSLGKMQKNDKKSRSKKRKLTKNRTKKQVRRRKTKNKK
tara:strand:- start:666 stop:1427 length:762 start_codon:yes stop_codon:yes gene_type:complete